MIDLKKRVKWTFDIISREFRHPLSSLDMTLRDRVDAERDLREIESARPEKVADALLEIGVGLIFGITTTSSYARKTRAADAFIEMSRRIIRPTSEETEEER